MTDPRQLVALALVVMLINVPFGYWRAGTRKFTLRWFVAVHAPVPLVVALRLGTGVTARLGTIPLLIGAFFAGQMVGGALRKRWNARRGR